jgi:hypothetical protein
MSANSNSADATDNHSLPYISQLHEKQKECFEVYKYYLEDTTGRCADIPPVVLLTGAAGTGKSHVVLAIDSYAKQLNIPIIKTAFNNINAIDVDGPTLTKLAFLSGASSNHLDDIETATFNRLCSDYGYKDAKLIIVDEASNVVPHVYARLNQICQQATNNYKQYFGGIPILIVGDFHQKGPVKNDIITTGIMSLTRHKKLLEIQNKFLQEQGDVINMAEFQAPGRKSTESNHGRSHIFLRIKKKTHVPSDAIFSKSKFKHGSPFRTGCEIFSSAKWIELSQQQRSDDPVHTEFVVKMSKGEEIGTSDLNKYKPLCEDDLATGTVVGIQLRL